MTKVCFQTPNVYLTDIAKIYSEKRMTFFTRMIWYHLVGLDLIQGGIYEKNIIFN